MSTKRLERLFQMGVESAQNALSTAQAASECSKSARANNQEAIAQHWDRMSAAYHQVQTVMQLSAVVAQSAAAIVEAIRDSGRDVSAPEPRPPEDVESQSH